MSSTMNAVGLSVPPRRRASVAAITNPSMVPATLPSSKMAARDRAQSWRGKYLHALNICSQDIELARRKTETATQDGKARVRAMSFHRSDFSDHLAKSRSYSSSTEKQNEERKMLKRSTQSDRQRRPQQHRIQGVPLRAPSTDVGSATLPMPTTSNPYGFTMRPNIARGRRCHTDPFAMEERISAPIQIPSAMTVSSQLDGNMRHRRAQPIQAEADVPSNNVRLLSWEEPVAMLAAADAVSKGWHMPQMSSMELGVRRGRKDDEPALHNHHEDDDDDDHDGDIFAMDECDEDDNQVSNAPKSRRRYRTESMNIATNGREKRTHHVYDFHGDFDFQNQNLSSSFVPPHEMVNRNDCFTVGLRDDLKKRRPAPHL